jgi:hypothetical protein
MNSNPDDYLEMLRLLECILNDYSDADSRPKEQLELYGKHKASRQTEEIKPVRRLLVMADSHKTNRKKVSRIKPRTRKARVKNRSKVIKSNARAGAR